ncbi:MAG: hypothetical protein QW128_05260 [Thermoprotei archaeon]
MVSKPEFEHYLKTLQVFGRLSGVSLNEAHKILGYEYGKRLARNLRSDNLIDLLNEASLLLEQNDLGHTEIEKKDPIRLTVYRCLGCEWIPDAVSSVATCPLREGLLESIVHEKLNVNIKVTSTSTGSSYGDKVCKFEVHLARE